MADVIDFPKDDGPTGLFVGPFQEYRVVWEGKRVPFLTGSEDGDMVHLTVDNRFGGSFPKAYAHQVVHLLTEAMAVAAGYKHFDADTKDHAFAFRLVGLPEIPTV